jgi:hypothetical protein
MGNPAGVKKKLKEKRRKKQDARVLAKALAQQPAAPAKK